MTNQDQTNLQMLTYTEQHQLDGGVYLFGPDVHIVPKFPFGPFAPIDGLIVIDIPDMMTHSTGLL